MIQERVRQNLQGSGRVGGGGFPYDSLEYRILQHFLPKLDARKSDDSNRGAIQSLGAAAPRDV